MNLEENGSKLLYIACPYTHSEPAMREHRYRMSCIAAAKLFAAGIVAFNPLANSVPAVEFGGIDLSHREWMGIDLPILRRSDEVLILGLDGWTKSQGVKSEMFEAMMLRKPIMLIEEADIEMLPQVPKSAKRFLKSKILTDIAL